MTLAARYIDHLRAPRQHAAELAGELATAGLTVEAGCVRAWSKGDELVDNISVTATPPREAEVGASWFDPCDLTIHVHTGRSWLATRPVARWQMAGFLAVAERQPRAVQVEPPFTAFDPARLVPGDETARCTEVTHGEAQLYAWYLRKGLPDWLEWQLVAEEHAELLSRLHLTREWCSGAMDDEAARIVIAPATITSDPDETPEMIRGEYTRDLAIGFRPSILLQIGLLPTVTSWGLNVEPVKLAALVDRARF